MPAFGNIVLADGQSTPVNHTFIPVVIDAQGVAHYEDTAGGIPIGYPRLSLSLKRPTASTAPGSNSRSAVYRARVKIEVPVLEVTSPSTGTGIQPAPTIAYSSMADMQFLMSARSTEAERKDIVAYAKNALLNAAVVDVLTKLQNIY